MCFKKHGFPSLWKKGSIVNNVSSDDCESEDPQDEETQQTTNFSLTKDHYEGLIALL